MKKFILTLCGVFTLFVGFVSWDSVPKNIKTFDDDRIKIEYVKNNNSEFDIKITVDNRDIEAYDINVKGDNATVSILAE